MSRSANVSRTTKETSVEVCLDLDGSGTTDVSTGLPFFDHMLDQFGHHGGLNLTVRAAGDVRVDAHHTVEDVGLAIGQAIREALGEEGSVRRFASGLYPLDEALVEVAVDLIGHSHASIDLPFGAVLPMGNPPFPPEMATHFFESLAGRAQLTLHVTKKAGTNTHHIVEAAFKGVARTLRDAVRPEGDGEPSIGGTP